MKNKILATLLLSCIICTNNILSFPEIPKAIQERKTLIAGSILTFATISEILIRHGLVKKDLKEDFKKKVEISWALLTCANKTSRQKIKDSLKNNRHSVIELATLFASLGIISTGVVFEIQNCFSKKSNSENEKINCHKVLDRKKVKSLYQQFLTARNKTITKELKTIKKLKKAFRKTLKHKKRQNLIEVAKKKMNNKQ